MSTISWHNSLVPSPIYSLTSSALLILAGSITHTSAHNGRHQYQHSWRSAKTPDVTHSGDDVCRLHFSKSGKLKTHLKSHTEYKQFSCSQCDTAFCTSGDLKRQMCLHTGEKPFATVLSPRQVTCRDIRSHTQERSLLSAITANRLSLLKKTLRDLRTCTQERCLFPAPSADT